MPGDGSFDKARKIIEDMGFDGLKHLPGIADAQSAYYQREPMPSRCLPTLHFLTRDCDWKWEGTDFESCVTNHLHSTLDAPIREIYDAFQPLVNAFHENRRPQKSRERFFDQHKAEIDQLIRRLSVKRDGFDVLGRVERNFATCEQDFGFLRGYLLDVFGDPANLVFFEIPKLSSAYSEYLGKTTARKTREAGETREEILGEAEKRELVEKGFCEDTAVYRELDDLNGENSSRRGLK